MPRGIFFDPLRSVVEFRVTPGRTLDERIFRPLVLVVGLEKRYRRDNDRSLGFAAGGNAAKFIDQDTYRPDTGDSTPDILQSHIVQELHTPLYIDRISPSDR